MSRKSMNRWLRFAIICLSTSCSAARRGGDTAGLFVLRGVTVVDGTGAAPQPDRDVLISGDRIAGIVPTRGSRYGEADQMLDLPGRFVIPGLIDTHAHVTVLEFHRSPDGGTRAEYRRDLSERALRLLLAHGVTTVRNPSAPAAEGVALRKDVAAGVIPGPRRPPKAGGGPFP